MDWRENVYGKDEEQFWIDFVDYEETTKLRPLVLKRDRFSCRRCKKRFSEKKLSVHHIIPRERFGPNTLGNLITLCVPCHDFVELNIDRFPDAMSIELNGSVIDTLRNDDEPKDWHAIVYGGRRQ